jgi:hypothetical protein
MNEVIVPLIRYGNVPTREKRIHEKLTARNPSRMFVLFRSAPLELVQIINQRIAEMRADQRKGLSGSLYIRAGIRQRRNAAVSIRSIGLRKRRMISGLMSFITAL